jgi:hypothetical protein
MKPQPAGRSIPRPSEEIESRRAKASSGETQPNWETVQLLALALGVTCEAFMSEGLELPDSPEPKRRGLPSGR